MGKLDININDKPFIPTIGETVEIIYSEDNFDVGDKVIVLEGHEQEDFWVVGNDDPTKYNESLHINNFKKIN